MALLLWFCLIFLFNFAWTISPSTLAAVIPSASKVSSSHIDQAPAKPPGRLFRGPARSIRSALSIARKPFRDLNFWGRTLRIYGSYKTQQLYNRLQRKSPNDINFNATHEVNSRRMINLCLSLRGFYLKTGQFLGTRHDFMPLTYISKLTRLHDDVPSLPAAEIRVILERELGGKLDQYFTSLDLDKPIGSASIAQVHKGVWKASGETVAVKVQYPNAERLMKGDLKNLRRLAEFLQKTELKFDLLSAIKELQKQIHNEFDFEGEARNMDFIRQGLLRPCPEVTLPRSIFATKRALVMTFVEGDNLSKLAEYKSSPSLISGILKRRMGKKLLDVLAKAWGIMIFDLRNFNSDLHPGNVCLSQQHGVGLLDWGQVKRVSDSLAVDFSKLVVAINSKKESEIVDAFFALGIRVSNPSDRKTVKAIALTMFDTQRVPDYIIDPFNPRNSLKSNSVTKMPSDIYFLLRTVQLFRGISYAFDLDYSLADRWGTYANGVLKKAAAEKGG